MSLPARRASRWAARLFLCQIGFVPAQCRLGPSRQSCLAFDARVSADEYAAFVSRISGQPTPLHWSALPMFASHPLPPRSSSLFINGGGLPESDQPPDARNHNPVLTYLILPSNQQSTASAPFYTHMRIQECRKRPACGAFRCLNERDLPRHERARHILAARQPDQPLRNAVEQPTGHKKTAAPLARNCGMCFPRTAPAGAAGFRNAA